MVTKKQQQRSDELMDILDDRSGPHLFDAVNEKWFKDIYADYIKDHPASIKKNKLKAKLKKKRSVKK